MIPAHRYVVAQLVSLYGAEALRAEVTRWERRMTPAIDAEFLALETTRRPLRDDEPTVRVGDL